MQIFELNSSRSIYELAFLATVINSPFHSYFLLCKVAVIKACVGRCKVVCNHAGN